MHIFHEQNFGRCLDSKKKEGNSTKRGSVCGLKKSTPIMVDTRPWLMRKALFEPPYTQGLSFSDLLEKHRCGAQVLIKPERL